ncbi:hypothetical protein ARMSODRAFT_1020937 [Armillaria solidipes]|uniref:Uncharacterized protein n=1 Tax=Armillaria solidipes TaxID=1076256 RepID=A0A2H3BLQ5_9AGAR|nr:hypothetical protein ARMSODRAFT_1020937 [Armillaria solidipes]
MKISTHITLLPFIRFFFGFALESALLAFDFQSATLTSKLRESLCIAEEHVAEETIDEVRPCLTPGRETGEQPSQQDLGSQAVTATQTFDNNSSGQGYPSTLTPASSSEDMPGGGSAPVHGRRSTPESTLLPFHKPYRRSSILNRTPASTNRPCTSSPAGVANATSNGTGPTDQHGSAPTGVTHPPSTPSHSESGLSKGADDGPTSLIRAPIDPTTASDHHASSSATAESDPSLIPLLVHNSEDVELSTYTTTFTSLKTFFALTTITTSPPPTTMTTSTPYLTSTELITSTIVVSVTTARSTFRPSKAQIGGIVAGSLGLFALLVAVLIYLIRRKYRRMYSVHNATRSFESDAEVGPATTCLQTSSVDITNRSDGEHHAGSSLYPSSQTRLVPESPNLPVDPLSRRMTQSSRIAYEEEIARLRQEVLSQTNRVRYMDEQMEFLHIGSPPPSYRSRSSLRSAISRISGSSPPPLPSREISH